MFLACASVLARSSVITMSIDITPVCAPGALIDGLARLPIITRLASALVLSWRLICAAGMGSTNRLLLKAAVDSFTCFAGTCPSWVALARVRTRPNMGALGIV